VDGIRPGKRGDARLRPPDDRRRRLSINTHGGPYRKTRASTGQYFFASSRRRSPRLWPTGSRDQGRPRRGLLTYFTEELPAARRRAFLSTT
jgi:hypothetical protein